MRRRQIWAAMASPEEWPKVIPFPPPKVELGRGHCKKCGRYIGKGIAFHTKACKG